VVLKWQAKWTSEYRLQRKGARDAPASRDSSLALVRSAHKTRRRRRRHITAVSPSSRPFPAVGPVSLQLPETMASGLDMSLDDLIKKSKSRPKANPASSSGPARRAPHPARAAPYPPAAPKVRRVRPAPSLPRVSLRQKTLTPPPPAGLCPLVPPRPVPPPTRPTGSTPSTSPL